MWRWLAVQSCLLLLVLMPAGAAAQSPTQQYELARNAFAYQDYAKVVKLLQPLLHPEPTLPSSEMVQQAREWLGAAWWWTGDKAGFKQELTLLLQDDPGFELDAFYYPPDMVADFQALKKQLREAGIIGEPVPEKVRTQVIVEKTWERRPGGINLLPFGVGQFANDRAGKGAFFLTAQLAFVGGNIGSWLYLYYGQPTGEARTLSIAAMYGSLGLFAGCYLWGVLDAYADWEPRRLIEEKRLELPEESASMIHIVPFPAAGGGLGLGVNASF